MEIGLDGGGKREVGGGRPTWEQLGHQGQKYRERLPQDVYAATSAKKRLPPQSLMSKGLGF